MALSLEMLESQTTELLPAREVMSTCSGGGGWNDDGDNNGCGCPGDDNSINDSFNDNSTTKDSFNIGLLNGSGDDGNVSLKLLS